MDILIISIRGIAIILFIITGIFLYRFKKEFKNYKDEEEIAEDYFEKIKRVLILNIIAIILSLIGSLLKIILETRNVLQNYFI